MLLLLLCLLMCLLLRLLPLVMMKHLHSQKGLPLLPGQLVLMLLMAKVCVTVDSQGT